MCGILSGKMHFYVFLLLALNYGRAQEYTQIDDIPIEHFDPVEMHEDDIDLELLPRRQRFTEPKIDFFKFIENHLETDTNVGAPQNLPNPGGLYLVNSVKHNTRTKRNTLDKSLDTNLSKTEKTLVKLLGKPLELSVLETENLTASTDDYTPTKMENNTFIINDFLRFRRSTPKPPKQNENMNGSASTAFSGKTEKLIMEPDTTRETRGTNKEQWTRQIYPIRRNDEMNFDDNLPASNENIQRIPRVHFVTQKMSESSPPQYRMYERESRANILPRDFYRDAPRDLDREANYYQPRYTRQYRPMERPYYRDDIHSRYEIRDPRGMYRPRYENYEKETNTFSPSNTQRQRRIIYYATLPDVSRTPPNVDLRDRYSYRERYDDRYIDPYRYRKSYPKSRYEETDRGKTPYPVKVSTDVNVKEVKKIPERRIYSEVDRNRYGYNTPYQYT